MQAMEISRTGLDVEWRRLELIAENLANVNSANGKTVSYQPMTLVTGPKNEFAKHLAPTTTQGPIDLNQLSGVAVYAVQASNAPPRMVHEPGNPNANAAGFVTYPAIDQGTEMTKMIQTSRAYESNLVAMNAAKEMYSKAL